MNQAKRVLSIETHATRHLMGRIARGIGLREALRDLVTEHDLRTAWISAIGAFEWVELTEYHQIERRYEEAHRFERCEILSMQGNLSERDGEPFWHLHGALSLREDGRDVTYGGHIGDGVVFAVEFRIDCFDDLELQRSSDEATGLQLWAHAQPTRRERSPQGGAESISENVSWAMAAEASSSARAEVTIEHEPRKGDWIEHAKFGLCKIEALTGDGVCIIKLPDARRKKIKLGAMQVCAPRDDAGRLVFPVRPRQKA